MSILRGVDGCKGGWLCTSLDLSTGIVSARVYADAEKLFADRSPVVTAIDIPIGLPTREPRRCDIEVRRLLGPRRSSVFPTPVRAALTADSYKAACLASERACGKKLSKQAYAILPKILEVDTALQDSQLLLDTLFEVHPELSFCFWNGGRPMTHPKTSGFGFMERFELATDVFGDAVREIRDAIPRKMAADDDILDALATLWTAKRIHAGEAVTIPSRPDSDEHRLPMRMVA